MLRLKHCLRRHIESTSRNEFKQRFPYFLGTFPATIGWVSQQTLKTARAVWRWGGKRKESLQLHLQNLNICIEKAIEKCWLAGITLLMTSLPLVRAFTWFSMFVYSCTFALFLLYADRSVNVEPQRELEVEFKFQRCSCKIFFPLPPHHQSNPESPRLVCDKRRLQTCRLAGTRGKPCCGML